MAFEGLREVRKMKKRILVAYTSNAGSTGEVAQAIGKELGQDGSHVDVLHVKNVRDVSTYDAVLVGGPMIMGWHGEAVKFVERNQIALSKVPVAYFLTALSLTALHSDSYGGLPVFQDPALAKPVKNASKLSFKEKRTSVPHYLSPVLTKAPAVKPVGTAFFAGKLEPEKLNLFQRLFVKIIVGGQAGDRRNWSAIRSWASDLRPRLQCT